MEEQKDHKFHFNYLGFQLTVVSCDVTAQGNREVDLLNQKNSFSSVSPEDVKHKHKNRLQQMEQSADRESGVLTIKGEGSIFRLLKKIL